MPKISDNLSNTVLMSNLHYLIKSNNLTAVKLAKSIGASSESINKLRSGSLKNPTLKMLLGITKFFGISIENLVYDNLQEKMRGPLANIKVACLPVISWHDIENWQNAVPRSYVVSDKLDSKNCFALEIEHESGEFVSGAKVLIDTNLKPSTNSYVLVLNKDHHQFHIKRFVIDDVSYLQSIIAGVNNTTKYVESEQQIYGVIVAYQKSF